MPSVEGKAPDGKGGLNIQFVDAEGRAGVTSIAETDQSHATLEGGAFIFHSADNACGGEESWYLQNDGEDIRVCRIEVSTSATGLFDVMRKTSTCAVTGTTMNGRAAILGQAVMSDVTAFGSASVAGCVDGDVIVGHDVGTTDPYTFHLDGMIIPKGEAMFVRTVTTGIVRITGFVHRD